MAEFGRRAFLVVMDGVGVGGAPDASAYDDEGSDTLGNLARHFGGLSLPAFQALGLGNASSIEGVPPVEAPQACFGRMQELSNGKDSINGHWELAGLVTELPFPTYPDAFPEDLLALIEREAGVGMLGNEVASGTEIMDRMGAEHMQTGKPILYTSADSVIQLLAHEEVVPLEELYGMCERIHKALPKQHRVGRVIARPFLGQPGSFERTPNRKDYAVEPTGETVLDKLVAADIDVHGIGKVDTLFAGRGFTTATHTKSNGEGIDLTLQQIRELQSGFVFANLLDFDQKWGHRNDTDGFKSGMEELDSRLHEWIDELRDGDLLLLSADHGNDPTTPSTDHSREHVPLLVIVGGSKTGVDLGLRMGFTDVAATLADYFGVPWQGSGASFLSSLPL